MSNPNPSLLRLKFMGQPMATLAYRPDLPAYALEFDRDFVARNHDLSPLNLPLARYGTGVHLFRPGDSPFAGGLPGLIADSLPDAWGERMLKQESPEVRTVMGKLAAIGQRGPGAITFEPEFGSGRDRESIETNLNALARDAETIGTVPVALSTEKVNAALAHGGSSLGGAFPKTSAHLPFTGESIKRRSILVGGPPPPGHQPAILKFARSTDEAEGAVEFAFWLMARNAGIRVPPACLVHDCERRHFASARFDRMLHADGTWGRRHVHTLSGLLHKRASDGMIDYEEFMRLTRSLCGVQEAAECFRRAVFNLLATNRDDHGRNHAFLYDETKRTWELAPAYDLNPNIANVLIGLSWMGSLQIPTDFGDVLKLAKIGGIDLTKARAVYEQVETAVLGGWRKAAIEADVPLPMIDYWQHELEVQTKSLRLSARSAD